MNFALNSIHALILCCCIFIASCNISCGTTSSCKGRCFVANSAGDVDVSGEYGEGTRLVRLGCRCDYLCHFYGDCCADHTDLCPKDSHWQTMKYKMEQKYLQCQELVLNTSHTTLMVVNKCPASADPFVQVFCESEPNFFKLHSFIPVTGPDGRVYRNKYCAKCVHPKLNRIYPWEISYVRCSSAFRHLYEKGFDDIIKRDQNLQKHIFSLVKKWMSDNCRPILKPNPSSNIHYCDPEMQRRKNSESCDGPYNPVWVRSDEGSPIVFPNKRCAVTNGHGENATKHCLSNNPDAAVNYLFSSYGYAKRDGKLPQAYYPGSLTILLNFGPDGKIELNMIDKDKMSQVKACPRGSVLERATNTCKKLVCPTGSILLPDGTCETIKEIQENIRYETRMTMNLSVRYDTAIFPSEWLPATEDFLKLSFEKYFHIDDGGMLNFSIMARAVRDDKSGSNSSVTSVSSFFDIFAALVLKDETQNDARIVQRMFDDFNKRLADVDRNSEAFKITKMSEKIAHMPIRDKNCSESGKDKDGEDPLNWCPNGDLKFYDGNSTFEYWQEERKRQDGATKNETFVKTYDTDTIYKTGQFDLMIFLETDLNTNEEVVKQIVRVCQRHPWIEKRNCQTKVMLNKTEYRILKNRSVEVLADHQIYGINEYEICHTISKLMPPGNAVAVSAKPEPTLRFNKILVCLHPPEKRRETMFITFSALQGVMTLILLPISLIFLLATISIYFFFKKLRNLPGLILLHLTISLLLSQSLILFILNFDLGISWSCTIVAVANHYLLLMSFCWTNTYAYIIYRTFTTFKNLSALKDFSVSNKMRKYCLYSYGMPCLLVAICMTIDATTGWMHYGGDNLVFMVSDEHGGQNATYYGSACWINNPTASISFFGVPALTMVIVNGVFYVITVRHVKEGAKKMQTGRRISTVSVNADSPVDLKTFMRLSSVMGFTWILGYSSAFIKSFAVSSFGSTLVEVIAFFFIVSTALQGVAIFVAFTTGKRVKALLAENLGGTRLEWAARRFSKDSVSTISTPSATP